MKTFHLVQMTMMMTFSPTTLPFLGMVSQDKGLQCPHLLFQPFNPFAAPNPNPHHLQYLGWGIWPNQGPFGAVVDAQQLVQPEPDEDLVPQLIPIQPENAEEVINLLDGQEMNNQNLQPEQEIEAEFIAMDDLTDASDNEPEPHLCLLNMCRLFIFPTSRICSLSFLKKWTIMIFWVMLINMTMWTLHQSIKITFMLKFINLLLTQFSVHGPVLHLSLNQALRLLDSG